MKKLLIATAIISLALSGQALAAKKAKKVVKHQGYTRCAGLAGGLKGCNPWQTTFSPVVWAADTSINIIGATVYSFR